VEFVTRKVRKTHKLVESQTLGSPYSDHQLCARQRDFEELVGAIDRCGHRELSATSKHWEATIRHDQARGPQTCRPSPMKRILKTEVPKRPDSNWTKPSGNAAGFQKEVLDVLLHESIPTSAFRQGIPFQPSLVDTLVTSRHFCQAAKRTALKIMLQLLVEQKDRLKLGEYRSGGRFCRRRRGGRRGPSAT